ncbi:MAG: hypothetical protein II942_01215 [Alphaproteobacteria bacterium]|nr:hypothetical protein [Alphaproteobacteria bacterium]
MRENHKNALYRHAQYLNLGIKDSREWQMSEDRRATDKEVAAGMKEAEVYVKATQRALASYTAPWMDKPYGTLDKQTEGLLLRGWAQSIVRARTGMNLQEMIFRQQHMSPKQWDARIEAEKSKLIKEWTDQDKAYLAEEERLRAAREGASK